MKKLCIVVVLLIALWVLPSLAQDSPLTTERMFAEIGRLHMQIGLYQEALQKLQASLQQLQAENDKLKAAAETPKP